MVALLAHNLPEPNFVDATQRVGQVREDFRHLVVVVDVQRSYCDLDVRIALREFGPELLESLGATGAQREVAALGGERAGHPGTQARAGSGDEDFLSSHPTI
jgi:hypothetical protein